jgi:hypothetical protein
MALIGQSKHTRECPLSDNSGQRWILARDGLSAYDPTATFATQKEVSLLKMAAS